MDKILSLRISTSENQESSNIFFLPSAVLHNMMTMPNAGLSIFEAELDDGVFYSEASTMLLGEEDGKLVVASTRVDLFESLFTGFRGEVHDPDHHSVVCKSLGTEVEYFILENPIIDVMNITISKISNLVQRLPGMEKFVDRISMFEISADGVQVHVILQPNREDQAYNSEIIDLSNPYYIPEGKMVRIFLSKDKVFFATQNPDSLAEMFSTADVEILENHKSVGFCIQQGIPLDSSIVVVAGVEVKSGFYVRSEYHKDVADDRKKKFDKGLEEFMKGV